MHALRDALVLPARKIADDSLTKLRWLYDGRNAEEGRRDLAAWLLRWQEKYPRLCVWVEENIEETLTFYRLPREHHKHLKTTNMLERLNRQIKRRTRVIGIFPTRKAVCDSFEARGRNPRRLDRSSRYLNMEMLRDPPFRSQITSPQEKSGPGLASLVRSLPSPKDLAVPFALCLANNTLALSSRTVRAISKPRS